MPHLQIAFCGPSVSLQSFYVPGETQELFLFYHHLTPSMSLQEEVAPHLGTLPMDPHVRSTLLSTSLVYLYGLAGTIAIALPTVDPHIPSIMFLATL
ncbi:hypothetical protein FB45DRAFT_1044364 [Roridomyces roridus]|uniref:Uncharacterized protein n=1 Tax=Roridomyces roridus TaxID=1738132 RepID=A0AAD7AYN6_9AGAR|nr:hypothetical protein FB45DRAFT_1044364 [Roridomyces roridus]